VKESRRSLRQALRDALHQIVVTVIDHLPLVGGALLVFWLDELRRSLGDWGLTGGSARLVKVAFWLGEGTLFVSLVLPKAIELVTELAEAVAVAHRRIREAWRRGRRTPRK
jgi:hypothetical protein